MSKPNLSLGSILIKIGIVSFALSVLVATTQSLTLTMGGNTLGASPGATATASVSSWILTVIFMTVFQGFFLTVITFIGAIGFSFASKACADLNEAQRGTFRKLVKFAVFADLGLALLIGIYNGSAQYAIFSALHADPAINLVTSILAGLITTIYASGILAFIGTIAAIIFTTFALVLSGGMNKRNRTPGAPNDTN